MSKPSSARFSQAASICLAFLFITAVLLVQHHAAHATPPAAAADQLVWVRQEPPVINVNGDPLRIESTEERFAGSFTQYTVSETAIAMEQRYVDHGYEWYHVNLASEFERPPLVLNPPLRYQVSANFTHSGAYNGGGAIGAQFWYASNAAAIEPREVLAYYPYPGPSGPSSKEWMIAAPAIAAEGDTFELVAGWWNCPPCNVTWTYRAEPANAVEQLGVEVLRPVVTYQGAEVPPGETFFPDTCALPAYRSTANGCKAMIGLTGAGEAYYACVVGTVNRVLIIMSRTEVSWTKQELILHVVLSQVAELCRYNARTAVQPQLGLALQQGAMTLTNVVNQPVDVHTPLATAVVRAPGAFLTGYNPDTGVAIFRAYSVPLTIQPREGSALILPPPHQVTLTAAGFGPVTTLPHAFLPVLIR